MRVMKYLSALALAGLLFMVSPTPSQAQVSFSLQIGPAPACPYGYYAYPPYNCAPFGYYGPQWFTGGVFIGAGPWFRGPADFDGYVNHYYDPRYGYHGPFPYRGERPDWDRHRDWVEHWRGNDRFDGRGPYWRRYHDNGRGHAYGRYENHGRGNAYGHYKDHGNPHDRGGYDRGGYGRGNGHGHGNDHGNGHGHGH
jgi:hypothetical protein